MATTIRICAMCQQANARSPHASYCGPCHAEIVKRNRRESAARGRRRDGSLEMGASFSCERCFGVAIRRSPSQAYCKSCGDEVRKQNHRVANKKYEATRPPRKRNTPTDRANQRRWIENNRERRLRAARAYNDKNRDLINAKSRAYLALPETKIKRREIDRRYRAQPKHRVDSRMKTAIRLSLRGTKAGRSWESLVGYTLEELVQHLERQFVAGMTWDNIGEWEIDHIRPKSMFKYVDASDPAFRECWSLTNLRPLWAQENRSKHAKVTHLI